MICYPSMQESAATISPLQQFLGMCCKMRCRYTIWIVPCQGIPRSGLWHCCLAQCCPDSCASAGALKYESASLPTGQALCSRAVAGIDMSPLVQDVQQTAQWPWSHAWCLWDPCQCVGALQGAFVPRPVVHASAAKATQALTVAIARLATTDRALAACQLRLVSVMHCSNITS